MRLFAIGDLHLSGGDDKPMDVFGPHWDRHFFRIQENWEQLVRPEDIVLIPGDISWAMKMENALPDLQEIGKLPGQKILCRGNHDYWWHAITRLREMLPPGMRALQADAADLGEWVVCGTRGWLFPTAGEPLNEDDRRIFRREVQRLKLALDSAENIARGRPLVVMTHFPPLYAGERDTEMTRLMEERGVSVAVYGHLHGEGIRAGFNGVHNGIRYQLVSCDSIDFCPLEILRGEEPEK